MSETKDGGAARACFESGGAWFVVVGPYSEDDARRYSEWVNVLGKHPCSGPVSPEALAWAEEQAKYIDQSAELKPFNVLRSTADALLHHRSKE